MNAITDYRTVSTPRVMPPRADRPFVAPTISFAELAKRENRAVMASWDQTASKFSGNKEAIAARRAEWMGALPQGPFERHVAADAWEVMGSTADNRITTLERAGLLKRLPVRPYMWERV